MLDFQGLRWYSWGRIGAKGMGTRFRRCEDCGELSRDRKSWRCSCKPAKIPAWDVKPLAKAKPQDNLPKSLVGHKYIPEHVNYKQWLRDNKLEHSSKAWTDYILRDLRVLPK